MNQTMRCRAATNNRHAVTTRHLTRGMLLLACLASTVASYDSDGLSCPNVCMCYRFYAPEYGPGVRVECTQGNMHTLPVSEMEQVIHQLVVTAPLEQPNFLSIGPVLTHPKPFSSLRDISIMNSNVPFIGEHSFWGLFNLRTLNLSRNNLTTIIKSSFRGLVSLIYLNLEYNFIGQMPSEAFGHLTNLKRLTLAHNQITSLNPRQFRMLGKLTELNISYNPLKELNPEAFKDIQQLICFKCRQCLLRRVNGQIYHLASGIEELDLGENLFKYLTDDEFLSLKKLKHLKLDGNQISVIVDSVFGQNHKLEFLDLANNRLALLAPGSLTNLSHLTYLDISYNRIEKFQLQAFGPVVNSLTSIDLSGNNLSVNEVTAVLRMFPDINDVGLANLSLKDIPQNFFDNNPRLETLNISSNQLTTFPYKPIIKSRFLRALDISNNKLTALNEDDLQRLEAISQIKLEKNTWHCDQCLVGTMLVYMKTTVLNESLRSLQCYTPLRLSSLRLLDLTTDILDPCPATFEAQMSLIASFVLVLMAMLAAAVVTVCCTRNRSARYYTNENKRRERQRDHPEELLPNSEQDRVATIHAPHQQVTNNS